MRIRPKFTPADVTKWAQRVSKKVQDAVLLRFQRIGERFIENARANDTYKDQTGNLRSSIGYVILKDGEQLTSSGFQVILNGGEGAEAGKRLVEELIARYKNRPGFVLICVAGMDYALAVEANGYDVLTASSIVAENELRKSLVELNDSLKRKS